MGTAYGGLLAFELVAPDSLQSVPGLVALRTPCYRMFGTQIGDHSRSQIPKSSHFQIGGSGLLAFDFVAPDGFGVFFLVSLASLGFRVCLGVEFKV